MNRINNSRNQLLLHALRTTVFGLRTSVSGLPPDFRLLTPDFPTIFNLTTLTYD